MAKISNNKSSVSKKTTSRRGSKNRTASNDKLLRRFAPWAFMLLFGIVGVYYLFTTFATTSLVKTGQLSVYLTNAAGKPMCLDDYQNSSANGADINIYPCSTTDPAQQWSLYSDNSIRIHGKCLDVYGFGTANGNRIDLYTCNGGNNQQWSVGTNPKLSLNNLVSKATGKCLDDYHSGTANSNNVDLWGCDGTDAQVWGWITNGSIVPGGATASANCHSEEMGDTCYYWNQAFQQGNGSFTASGVSAVLSQPNPAIGPQGPGPGSLNHSITEIFASSADGKQGVEIGWAKDVNHASPILFATDWVNHNVIANYGDNGGSQFVKVSAVAKLGETVKVGAKGTYKIQIASNQWQIWYNGVEIGYFPTSVWTSRGASFTTIQHLSVYGEVSDQYATVAKTQMGGGVLGNQAGASTVSNYTLYGNTMPAKLVNFGAPAGFMSWYNLGNTSTTGFTYGGSGAL